MNVYILTINDGWHSEEIAAVFQTIERAEQYVDKEYCICGDQYPNTNDKPTIQSYDIIGYEVIK